MILMKRKNVHKLKSSELIFENDRPPIDKIFCLDRPKVSRRLHTEN